jgi:DNA helicase-2/ATP-dependent DNA helicase PcrA
VRHGKFGEGVVMRSSGSGAHTLIEVNFEASGTKTLVLAYANLEVM